MAERIHANAQVTVRNLVREPLPPLSGDYARAVTGRAHRDDPALALSEHLIDELEQAHYLLISTPMHNYMVPAALKLWLDYVVRIQRSFTMVDGNKEGLLEDRPTFVVVSSGGNYLGARASQADFLSPYLRHILGVIGLHHVEFVHLQGLAQGPDVVAETCGRRARAWPTTPISPLPLPWSPCMSTLRLPYYQLSPRPTRAWPPPRRPSKPAASARG